jgi:hypothetical protein
VQTKTNATLQLMVGHFNTIIQRFVCLTPYVFILLQNVNNALPHDEFVTIGIFGFIVCCLHGHLYFYFEVGFAFVYM